MRILFSILCVSSIAFAGYETELSRSGDPRDAVLDRSCAAFSGQEKCIRSITPAPASPVRMNTSGNLPLLPPKGLPPIAVSNDELALMFCLRSTLIVKSTSPVLPTLHALEQCLKQSEGKPGTPLPSEFSPYRPLSSLSSPPVAPFGVIPNLIGDDVVGDEEELAFNC